MSFLSFIKNNAATLVIGGFLILTLTKIIYALIKSKSTCDKGCCGCLLADKCHRG